MELEILTKQDRTLLNTIQDQNRTLISQNAALLLALERINDMSQTTDATDLVAAKLANLSASAETANTYIQAQLPAASDIAAITALGTTVDQMNATLQATYPGAFPAAEPTTDATAEAPAAAAG